MDGKTKRYEKEKPALGGLIKHLRNSPERAFNRINRRYPVDQN